jgi:heme-degrading monooxygenase HmoA
MQTMFIAMNRFQVNAGREADFEARWSSRDSYLNDFAGFVHFALLRGATANGTTEYVSHTTWRSYEDFDGWRNSEQFKAAHAQGSVEGVLAGHPVVGLYQSVIEEAKQPLKIS